MTWFRVWTEISLVFVSGIEVDLIEFSVGVELNLVLSGGNKLTWF